MFCLHRIRFERQNADKHAEPSNQYGTIIESKKGNRHDLTSWYLIL